MSSQRAERLVNLVICLLSTRQFLAASRIRALVPGYGSAAGDASADEAFKCMFERDKAELRELGVPLETGRNSAFDTDEGYRIARRDYELPEIELAPDEAAAVGLAARLWQSAGLAAASRGALRKLRAGGAEIEPSLAIQPRIEASEPTFDACLAAVRARCPITFDYRTPRSTSPARRTVEPWGVVSWHGRWYVVGHDRDRDAPRCFRLSRMVGEVETAGAPGSVTPPDDVDLVAAVSTQSPPLHTARVRVAAGAAAGLRRLGRVVQSADGADVVELDYGDPQTLAARLAGHGRSVVVLDPPDVRAAVVARLRARAADETAEPGRAPTPAGAADPGARS
ncbi:MAG: helix-turn-helix transcriptional regulator [Mycobacteriales bacterium]